MRMSQVDPSLISESPVHIRGMPDRDSEEYRALVASVRELGVLAPVIVCPGPGDRLSVVDGLRRVMAARDAGLVQIPAVIADLSPAQQLDYQMMTSGSSTTTPHEYRMHLMRILACEPALTMERLSVRIGQPASWIAGMMRLDKLAPAIRKLVLDGRICVANACYLAKKPKREQERIVTDAMNMSAHEFVLLYYRKKT